MNRDDGIWIISYIMESWTAAQQWTDRQCEMWIADLEPLDFGRAREAVKACRREHHYVPSWAQFCEAYRTITWQQLAPERQPPGKAIEAGYIPKAESAQRAREVKAMLGRASAKLAEHDHRKGAAACPLCGKHERNSEGLHKPEHCARCKEIAAQVQQRIGGQP